MYYDKIRGSGFRTLATLLALAYVAMGVYFPFFCKFESVALKEYFTTPSFYMFFAIAIFGIFISINAKATDVIGVVGLFIPTYYSLTEYSNLEGVAFDMMIPNALHIGACLLMILMVFSPSKLKLVLSYVCSIFNVVMLLLTTIAYNEAVQIFSDVDSGWYANIYNLVRMLAIFMISVAYIRESKKEIYNKEMSQYY